MRWILHAYIASLNVICAIVLVASMALSWINAPLPFALGFSVIGALILPLPFYVALANFQSAAELWRIPR